MSDRITNVDVRRLADRLEDLARRVDVLDADEVLVLDHGSVTYGRAWRLHSMAKAGTGGHHDGPFFLGSGFLGSTTREAYCALRGMVRALEAVAEARRRAEVAS
jgi:hypothetical protein